MELVHPQAGVFDFSQLSYEWGNASWNAVSRHRLGDPDVPVAMVVSEKCKGGFSTCAGALPQTFDTLEGAVYDCEQIAVARTDALMRDSS